jgi:hypothetical protein
MAKKLRYFNILSYKWNADQNDVEVPSHKKTNTHCKHICKCYSETPGYN